jgi:hypothetical protein
LLELPVNWSNYPDWANLRIRAVHYGEHVASAVVAGQGGVPAIAALAFFFLGVESA